MSTPQVGTCWRHYKGGIYTVIAVGKVEKDQTPCVVYQSLADGQVWVRPLSEWEEIVRLDDPEVFINVYQRFTPVERTHGGGRS